MREIAYVHEPDDLQCGQAVLAMLTGRTVSEIVGRLQNPRETTLAEMKKIMDTFGIQYSNERKEFMLKGELPGACLLSLETPRCWHWSLYVDGTFYDPEHGVLKDIPESRRKYYWEIYHF